MINKHGVEFTPILCVDFDGVIHSLKSGSQGDDQTIILDPPNLGALEWLKAAMEHWDVQIYSARSAHTGAIEAMKSWLFKHARDEWNHELATEFVARLKFPMQKPPAFLMIDDRAICFEGDFSTLDPEELLNFKPWYRRGREPIGLESP
jgi:hypothetical protein